MRRLRRMFAATVLVASVALGTASVASADDGLLGSALKGVTAPVGALVQSAVAPVLEPVAQAASEVIAPVVEPAAPVVDAAADTVSPVVEPVVEAVAPVVGTLMESVAPVVEPVEDALAPVVKPVKDALAPVVEPVEEALAPVVELVQTVAPVLDPIDETRPPASELSGGSAPQEPAAPGKPHPASGASPDGRVPPRGESAPSLHGSVEIPGPVMATAVAQAFEDAQKGVTPLAGPRFSIDSPAVAAPAPSLFSAYASTAVPATTPTQPEPAAKPSPLERFTGSLKALGDDVATFVSSNASWAAASISVAGAAALALVALMAFPGLWLRLRAASDRSPPAFTISLFERPG